MGRRTDFDWTPDEGEVPMGYATNATIDLGSRGERRVTSPTDAATLDDVHKLKCLHCGKPFTATRSDAKFDTARCRVAYHRKGKGLGQIRDKKVRRRCDQCGKSYWTSQPDRSRFDTDTCRAQWHHQHRSQKV